MTAKPYPYQAQQEIIDRYLEIPAADRPTFEEYVQGEYERIGVWAQSVYDMLAPAIQAAGQTMRQTAMNFMVTLWRYNNANAAARRRTWRKKASMVQSWLNAQSPFAANP